MVVGAGSFPPHAENPSVANHQQLDQCLKQVPTGNALLQLDARQKALVIRAILMEVQFILGPGARSDSTAGRARFIFRDWLALAFHCMPCKICHTSLARRRIFMAVK